MRKDRKIHDLDSLEKEIARLQTDANTIEKQLGDNLSYLKENATSFVVNSIFCARKKENSKENAHRFFKNERLNSFFSNVTENITDRLGDFLDKLWTRQRH